MLGQNSDIVHSYQLLISSDLSKPILQRFNCHLETLFIRVVNHNDIGAL